MQNSIPHRRLASLALSLTLLASTAQAGEGYTEVQSGKTVRLDGYSQSSSEIYSSPTINVSANRRVFLQSSTSFGFLSTTERINLKNDIMFAMGLWENIPSARISLGLGAEQSIEAFENDDNRNVVTLAGNGYAFGGECSGLLEGASSPRIEEFDIRLKRFLTRNEARAALTHEIGHGLGFNHSWLNDDCTGSLTFTPSSPSVMSYDTGGPSGAIYDSIATSGLVQPDDLALASRLYPKLMGVLSTNNIPCLSRSTGTIMGHVLRENGEDEIHGANVLLLNRSNGRAVASGVSGYTTIEAGEVADGSFSLAGVPPGSYDLLVTPWNDPGVTTNGALVQTMQLANGITNYLPAQNAFATDFDRAWVRAISVSVGQTVDVGYVVEGEDRPVSQPSLVNVTDYFGAGPYFGTFYWIYYSLDSDDFHVFITTIGSVTAQLPAGRYDLVKHRFVGTQYTYGGRSFRDYRGRRLDLTWTRPTKFHSTTSYGSWTLNRYVEALYLRVDFRQNVNGAPYRYRYVDGDRYTTYVVGGSYRRRTFRRWNETDGYEAHQGFANVSTN